MFCRPIVFKCDKVIELFGSSRPNANFATNKLWLQLRTPLNGSTPSPPYSNPSDFNPNAVLFGCLQR